MAPGPAVGAWLAGHQPSAHPNFFPCFPGRPRELVRAYPMDVGELPECAAPVEVPGAPWRAPAPAPRGPSTPQRRSVPPAQTIPAGLRCCRTPDGPPAIAAVDLLPGQAPARSHAAIPRVTGPCRSRVAACPCSSLLAPPVVAGQRSHICNASGRERRTGAPVGVARARLTRAPAAADFRPVRRPWRKASGFFAGTAPRRHGARVTRCRVARYRAASPGPGRRTVTAAPRPAASRSASWPGAGRRPARCCAPCHPQSCPLAPSAVRLQLGKRAVAAIPGAPEPTGSRALFPPERLRRRAGLGLRERCCTG
jgi:hypothetical protein